MPLPLRLPSFPLLVGVLVWMMPTLARGHTRLECPPPRSGETGAKVGPCDGPDVDELPAYPLAADAFNTITWLESISHPGAPARFALSLDGYDDGFESCLLLDHVPHDKYSLPVFTDEYTYHRSSITLYIPDVLCERCSLQLITVMTDEIHGVPVDTYCAYGGALAEGRTTVDASLPACPVVYHSCAPVSINGTVPRNEIAQCDTAEYETRLDWPFMNVAAHGPDRDELPQYSTYYYKGDPGIYNHADSRLLAGGAPIRNCDNFAHCDPEVFFDETVAVPSDAAYASLEGTCAGVVTKAVGPFALGQLPAEPKNITAPPGEIDPCAPCAPTERCFADGCPLRDPVTGNWSGPAEPCNQFAPPCEECFPESPCYLGKNSSNIEDDQIPDQDETSPATQPTATATPTTSAAAGTRLGWENRSFVVTLLFAACARSWF